MTPEQKELFVKTAILGLAAGLETPDEWLINIHLHAMNLYTYEEIGRGVLAEASDAFAALYREAAMPGDPDEHLTGEALSARLYERWNARATKETVCTAS